VRARACQCQIVSSSGSFGANQCHIGFILKCLATPRTRLTRCRDDFEQAILREGRLKLRNNFGSYFGRAQVFRYNVVVCCEKLRWFQIIAVARARCPRDRTN
jgi:hypothetical protein